MGRQRWTIGGLVALGLAVMFVAAPGGAWADIVPTGQYGPVYPGTDPWNVGDTPLQIGIDSSGEITVTGSVINAGTVAVGLKVKGGPDQLGELVIQNAGQVNASNAAFIGGASTDLMGGQLENKQEGTGRVSVGQGSSFAVGTSANGNLYVGYTGQGTLAVEGSTQSQGQVTADSVVVGAGPYATGHVDVSGGVLNAGHGITLGVWAGNASPNSVVMTIANGGRVTAGGLQVGGMDRDDVTELSSFLKQFLGPAHGSGTVNVQSGSTLTVAGPAYIGYAGPGTVNVTTGGQATSYETALGVISGSSGTLIVDGAAGGSLYRVAQNGAYETSSGARSGDLAIGPRGTGTVTVKNGGQVSVDNIVYVGGFHAGELPITQFEGASLGDVASGTGTLNVSEGGQVASGHGFLGYSPGSTGTANVTGADSKWNVAGNLFVGGTDTAAGGTGALNVSDGGLVDVMGDLTIWATGTLRGNGTVTVETSTTLHNHGTIAPGSSTALGTLTVNGNVVFEPGSTYAVKINQSGSDKLEVDGTTTINGGTVKVSSLGTVVGQHDYSIIHATSVTVPEGGGFGNPDTALLTFSVSDSSLAYDPTSVTLHLTAANFNDSTIAPTPNEQQVGTALQSIASSGGNDVTHALQQVQTPAELRQAYDQLSGLIRPALAPVAATENGRFLDAVSDRVQTLQMGMGAGTFDMGPVALSNPASRMPGGRMCDCAGLGQSVAVGNGSNVLAESPWGIWGRGYGLFGDRQTETDAPGYNYQMGGGALGLDYQFTDKFLAGAVFGYTDGYVDFSGMRDNADFRAIHAGLYGNLTWDKWYLNSTLAYGNVHYDTARFVDLTNERLTGDLNGNDWTAYFEGGRNVTVTPAVLLQPFVSLQYSFLGLGSYTETGGVSALSYGDQDYQSVKSGLGARLTGRLCESESGFRMDGQVRARWLREFGDNQSKVDTAFASNPATVFTIQDAAIARDSAVLGVGVSAKITKQLDASADYDALLNRDETVQLVSAGLEYRW